MRKVVSKTNREKGTNTHRGKPHKDSHKGN